MEIDCKRRAITRISRSVLYALSKAEILRGKHSFKDVFVHGKFVETTYLQGRISFVSDPKDTSGVRISVGFTIRRGLLTAVERNRLRRLMRESYRRNKNILLSKPEMLKKRVNLIFIYSPQFEIDVSAVSFKSIDSDLKMILSTIASRWFS